MISSRFRSISAVLLLAAAGVPRSASAQGGSLDSRCAVTAPVTSPSGATALVQQDACQKSIDLFNFLAPQLGALVAGGSAELGQGGTLGGLGHVRVGIRANVLGGGRLPAVGGVQLNTTGAVRTDFATNAQTLALPAVDAGIGLFGGLPVGLTRVGGVDLLLSGAYVPSFTSGQVRVDRTGSAVQIGYGARVGLLQRSRFVPGVGVTFLHREIPTTSIAAQTNDGGQIGVTAARVATDSWRVAVNQRFSILGLSAGAGQDRYDARATIAGSVFAPAVPGIDIARLVFTQTFAQRLTRTNVYAGATAPRRGHRAAHREKSVARPAGRRFQRTTASPGTRRRTVTPTSRSASASDVEMVPLTDDARHMRRALRVARRGWGRVAPNPLVGAVIVRDGVVVGEGWHAEYGGAHAEVAALRAAGEGARGATAYVTLEPCNHWGRTPPCVDALLAAGIARVVVAASDPHAIASGGAARLRGAGVIVDEGVLADRAVELNAPFFFDVTGGTRPWVTLKLALSIDAAIADHAHAPAWLTGARSRRLVHRMRAGHDAVAVGIGTALADDPLLTVRDVAPPRVHPLRIVFDRGARLPLEAALVRTAREWPTCVVCAPDAPEPRRRALEAAGVQVLRAASIDEACTALRAQGVRSLLVEGGAGIVGALWRADLVDRLVTFQAPVVLGAGALVGFGAAPSQSGRGARRLPVVRRRVLDDDLLTIYAVHPIPRRSVSSIP